MSVADAGKSRRAGARLTLLLLLAVIFTTGVRSRNPGKTLHARTRTQPVACCPRNQRDRQAEKPYLACTTVSEYPRRVWGDGDVISAPAGFRRHLAGK